MRWPKKRRTHRRRCIRCGTSNGAFEADDAAVRARLGDWVTPFVDNGARRLLLPVGALQEVNEVDAQRVVGLTDLPFRPSTFALELFAEWAYLVGEWFVRSRTCQKSADPADAVRRGLLLDEPSRQDELTELLKRDFELTQRRLLASAPTGRS